MVSCPQCGANLPLPERDAHARCRFCGTSFVPAPQETDHTFVPWALSALALRQTLKDHWIRLGIEPTPAELEAAEVRRFFLPFLRSSAGAVRPAFSSHRAELLAFVPPGVDLRRFTADAVGPDALVVEPSEEPDPNAGEGLLHYPFARAAASAAGGQRVLWIDAARGRVLGADRDPAGAAPRPTVALAGAFATYFAIGIALPLPWSLAAMGVATPFLLRWTERRLVGEA